MLTEAQIKKLEKLAKVGDIGIADELNALESKIEALQAIVPALREARDGEQGIQGERGEQGESIKGDKGETGRDGRDGKDSTVPGPQGPRGETGPQGVPGRDGVDGKDGDIKDLSPQEIRDSLELLQGEERIDVSSIRGVEEAITEIAEEIAKKEAKKVEGNTTVFTRVSSTGGTTTTGGAVWGGITGTLSEQGDLALALGAKADALGTDDNYVTDAEKAALHSHSNKTVLDNTTASFTTAQESKLGGIEAGAEVNVNADWNAVTGDAVIQNKPSIPDQLSDLSDDSTHRLVTDAEKSTWNAKLSSVKDTFGITIDGGTTALTTGTKGYRYIEQNCTITGWHVSANATGSIVFDVKRSTISLTGTEKPTLSSQQYTSDLALSTWTTTLSAGDIIEFVIDSASTITRATLTIVVTK